MLLSCKISNSVLTYIESLGHSCDDLLSATTLQPEFLYDPGSWIEALEMEKFLYLAQAEYRRHGLTGSVVEEAGLRSRDLMAWGVLDGVLKMMEKPQEILSQPDRFLSYFVAPPQTITQLTRQEGKVCFEVGISSRDFPSCTEYLKAVFESLPMYAGNPAAHVEWTLSVVTIDWIAAATQPALIPADSDRQINPDAVRDLLRQFEHVQLELETKKRQLVEKDARVDRLEAELKESLSKRGHVIDERSLREFSHNVKSDLAVPVGQVQNGLVRMADYFNRAQQLVVLLVGQHRMTPQVQEAMRRVDWDYVQREFPAMFKELCSSVQDVRDLAKDLENGTFERRFSEIKQKRQLELSALNWSEKSLKTLDSKPVNEIQS